MQSLVWFRLSWDKKRQPNAGPGLLGRGSQVSEDHHNLFSGAKYGEAIIETDLFREMGAEMVYPRFSDCPEPLTPVTDDYWRCVMRHIATSGQHLTSTVPFGDVIDNRLKSSDFIFRNFFLNS